MFLSLVFPIGKPTDSCVAQSLPAVSRQCTFLSLGRCCTCFYLIRAGRMVSMPSSMSCCGFMNVLDSGLHDLSTFSQRSLNSTGCEINASSLPRHLMNTCSMCSSNNVARSILSLISIPKQIAHCALLANLAQFSLFWYQSFQLTNVCRECLTEYSIARSRDASRETEVHFLLAVRLRYVWFPIHHLSITWNILQEYTKLSLRS